MLGLKTSELKFGGIARDSCETPADRDLYSCICKIKQDAAQRSSEDGGAEATEVH